MHFQILSLKQLVLFSTCFSVFFVCLQLKICPRSIRITIGLLRHFAREDDNKLTNLAGLAESDTAWKVPCISTETPSIWLVSTEFTNSRKSCSLKHYVSIPISLIASLCDLPYASYQLININNHYSGLCGYRACIL